MGKSKKMIEIFVHMIYLIYFSQQNDINMDFKSQTPNSEFLTEDMTKAEQRRRKKMQAYDKIMSGYSALQFMQKRYMVDGEYTEEFQAFMRNYDAASMKERIKSLVEENKKLKSDNRELICKLVQCREQIAKLELAQHNQKGTEE